MVPLVESVALLSQSYVLHHQTHPLSDTVRVERPSGRPNRFRILNLQMKTNRPPIEHVREQHPASL